MGSKNGMAGRRQGEEAAPVHEVRSECILNFVLGLNLLVVAVRHKEGLQCVSPDCEDSRL
jgi:hypothetical protein